MPNKPRCGRIALGAVAVPVRLTDRRAAASTLEAVIPTLIALQHVALGESMKAEENMVWLKALDERLTERSEGVQKAWVIIVRRDDFHRGSVPLSSEAAIDLL